MRDPIAFTYGNVVFGRGPHDPWAVLSIEPTSYAWLEEQNKIARLRRVMAALDATRADFQFLCVRRAWDASAYPREWTGRSAGSGRLDSYVAAQAERVASMGATVPVAFLVVSLAGAGRDPGPAAKAVKPRSAARGLLESFSPLRRFLMSPGELDRVVLLAAEAHRRVADHLPVAPARAVDIQWLVRRAFCRGLGEPRVEVLHEPAAVTFERDGRPVIEPIRGEILRWADSYVEHHVRCLRIESEMGISWQAQLALGSLPDSVTFPGGGAELMFAAAEQLTFPLDLSLNARFLPNEAAQKLARRRVQDADQIARAESSGELGLSDQSAERTRTARELLWRLQHSTRPPLHRASLAVAIAARSEAELERRIQECRRAFGETQLHRPAGDQLRLFMQHLPAQRSRVPGYEQVLTSEQIAAMTPGAAHIAGSRTGFYLGHTLTASRQPVRLNLREGSDGDGNAAILSVGALGSGKTTLAQKLAYEAFLQGARVIDCDPKGDHRFHLLADVAPHVEAISLRPDPSLRGLLDPLRVAPPHMRSEAAVSFLTALAPSGADGRWETAIVGAVDRVIGRAATPTCSEVVTALLAQGGPAAEVGAALEVHTRSGLAQLGFADAGARLAPVGSKQVTYLAIRDLPGPQPGAGRADYSHAERVGEQIVRLVAMLAMHLMAAERDRLKLFSFDEGWRLLGDPVGRVLLGSLQRMGRSELAVPVISTQLVTDAVVGERESLDNLIGATFVFGMRSDAEARRALALLGLAADEDRARRALLEMRAGQCLFRDHAGRIEAIQVDLAIESLMRELSTTPSRESRDQDART